MENRLVIFKMFKQKKIPPFRVDDSWWLKLIIIYMVSCLMQSKISGDSRNLIHAFNFLEVIERNQRS